MFRKRSLQVKLVKDTEKAVQQTIQNEVQFERKMTIIGHSVERIVIRVGVVVVAVILADAIRQGVTTEIAK